MASSSARHKRYKRQSLQFGCRPCILDTVCVPSNRMAPSISGSMAVGFSDTILVSPDAIKTLNLRRLTAPYAKLWLGKK